MMKYRLLFVAKLLLGALMLPRFLTSASISCDPGDHDMCERLLFRGSECRNGQCSNPFEKGCLQAVLNHGDYLGSSAALSRVAKRLKEGAGDGLLRACNSEDPMPEAVEQGLCVDYEGDLSIGNIYTDYVEVRLLSQNWESAIFASWILQILLSEVLRVPTTIESGTADAKVNFYSPTNEFGYGEYNDFGALETANSMPNADCRLLKEVQTGNNENYTSCGTVIPEYWAGDAKELFVKQREGMIDTPDVLGAIGQQGLFVTKFTAEQDPTVLHLLGIAGEANRRKLAETFLRPTTWQDYCELISPTNCTEPDDVAQRPPADESEYDRMFLAGSYTGHFRATEENDCNLNPTTCTGHLADFPCGWVSYIKPQMYYHNVAMTSSGKEPGSKGYSYSQLVEMYAAANATRSNLMTIWWQPEAMYSTYLGTEAEMQRVVLPTPTQECVENRMDSTKRCDFDDPMEQYGDPAGACDEAPQLLQKVIASGLYDGTFRDKISEARRSPAYDAIKAFRVSELQFGRMLQHWINRGVDTYGFDPRLATCLWVADNLDNLEDFIPRSHPRVGQETDPLDSPLFYVAILVGSLATVMAVITSVLTYRRRTGYVMKFSQVEFLFILLVGILCVSVGSIVLAIQPTNTSCLASVWLLSLGTTLELIPLIVKVGAMNQLMTAAKKMKRIVLTRRHLFGTVGLFVFVIVLFLVLWSTLDAPKRQGEFTLTDETTDDTEEHIVTINYYCASESQIWRYAAVVWHCILLLCATVLAFQTRKLQAGFSESSVLATVIYAQFLFVLLRAITFALEGVVSESYMASVRSLIYSTDAIVTLCVYFIPKLLTDDAAFYNLTHTASGKGETRNSVVSTSPHLSAPLVSNMSNSRAASKKTSKVRRSETDGKMSRTAQRIPKDGIVRESNKSRSSNRSRDDVFKDNRVSWGAACMTMIMADDDEENRESYDGDEAPFERPVDVLKDGKNSWGGGHMTLLLNDENDEDDEETNLRGASRIASIAEEPSAAPSKKSTLAPAILPKSAPERFGYAASRITRMRDVYQSEEEVISDEE